MGEEVACVEDIVMMDFGRIAEVSVGAASENARERYKTRLKRHGDTFETCVARALSIPHLADYVKERLMGRRHMAAAKQTKAEENWGVIAMWLEGDPLGELMREVIFNAKLSAAAQSALDLVQDAVDGVEVTKEGARMAPWVLDRVGAVKETKTQAATPSVTIVLGDGASYSRAGNGGAARGDGGNVIDL